MNQEATAFSESLNKIIGLNRQLLDILRMENNALVDSDLKGIQEAAHSKEAMISAIKQAESIRKKALETLSAKLGRQLSNLTLSGVIESLQDFDRSYAETLRNHFGVLKLLLSRIEAINEDNKALIQSGITHVSEMKNNILSKLNQHSQQYNAKGQQQSNARNDRGFFSKEY